MCCGIVLHTLVLEVSVFMLELRRELGDRFEHFQGLDSFAKSSGSEANYAPHRLRSLTMHY